MGPILRVAPPKRPPRRHVRHRSVPATLRHDVPSYDLALGRIWAKSVEKQRSYGIFSVFGGAAGGQPSGRRIRAISSFPSIDTPGRSQKKFEVNRTINGRENLK